MRTMPIVLPIAALLALSGCGSQPADLTGTWRLVVEESRWGRARPPAQVLVEIVHREPALHYAGQVEYADEHERLFAFDGLIDGNAYRVSRSYGEGTIQMTRQSARSVRSHFQTDDGAFVEDAVTTVSGDGRYLRRRIHVQGPRGGTTWTEVYRKL